MGDGCHTTGIAFFDHLAGTWDSLHDLTRLGTQLDAGIKRFGIKPDETILDVGCGTGNLTAALLRALSPKGSIAAIDLSSRMIEAAQAKVTDGRVRWLCGAVENLDVSPESFDRVICFSVWPHLVNAQQAAALFNRLLRQGGKLHIWHLISRQMVNKIHSQASEAVHDHLLSPAADTAALLEHARFIIEETQDDDNGYLVTARKDG